MHPGMSVALNDTFRATFRFTRHFILPETGLQMLIFPTPYSRSIIEALIEMVHTSVWRPSHLATWLSKSHCNLSVARESTRGKQ